MSYIKKKTSGCSILGLGIKLRANMNEITPVIIEDITPEADFSEEVDEILPISGIHKELVDLAEKFHSIHPLKDMYSGHRSLMNSYIGGIFWVDASDYSRHIELNIPHPFMGEAMENYAKANKFLLTGLYDLFNKYVGRGVLYPQKMHSDQWSQFANDPIYRAVFEIPDNMSAEERDVYMKSIGLLQYNGLWTGKTVSDRVSGTPPDSWGNTFNTITVNGSAGIGYWVDSGVSLRTSQPENSLDNLGW